MFTTCLLIAAMICFLCGAAVLKKDAKDGADTVLYLVCLLLTAAGTFGCVAVAVKLNQ